MLTRATNQVLVDVEPADICDCKSDEAISIFIHEMIQYTSDEINFSEELIKQLCLHLADYITPARKKKLIKQVIKKLGLEGYSLVKDK